MERNILNSLIGVSLALVITLGIGGGALILKNRSSNNDNLIVDEDNDYKIHDKGLGIKFLSSEKNLYDQEDKTFTYSINPENATNKKVNLEIKYQDGTECDDVMIASINTSLKTITLSCIADFDKKIIVTVTSQDNPSIKAEITLDYTKKILDVVKPYESIEIGQFNYQHAEINIDHFEDTYFYNPIYSKYTKDMNYNFNLKSFKITFDEFLGGVDGPWDEDLNYNLEKLLENSIINKTMISDEDLWNASSLNSWHSWLVASTNEGENYIGFNVSYSVFQNETKMLEDNVYIYLGTTNRNYSGKKVGVDSIIVETNNIEF